jgi:hypothetical protein
VDLRVGADRQSDRARSLLKITFRVAANLRLIHFTLLIALLSVRDADSARLGVGIEMGLQRSVWRTDLRHPANTIEEMQKLLIGYRDNMRVEVEAGVAVIASTVADLRALPTWPDGLVLSIHVDLDPRLSIVRVERAS